MDIQNRIENYWEDAAPSFNSWIQYELGSFKKNAWMKLISKNIPANDRLEVLDIGTGPGFFAIIMSEMTHHVTAVDCSPNMIHYASHNAKQAGVSPKFHMMDSHMLDFPDNQFDVVMCRNLTWTLKEPEKAYGEWKRVLKPGGTLLIFDANWYLRFFNSELNESFKEDMRRIEAMGLIDPYDYEDTQECDKISLALPLSRQYRPQWDLKVLQECGFTNIRQNPDITELVWDEDEKIRYRSTPLFMVRAQK
ncbi:class I SAM-dependent methyltransferase [Fusibacter ferrireducens]|uniref:Methyltransferase domain-containing protein n=1 Tax=Fusibacter ferrireducens TaxID=2785058 RepID=A0ABR9ZTZ5_9FIRM|nr:class I SAM-dependent methyltransferase [Fusibacter ferrireducens]MBF4693954.1 methyltransferase domain-containing protein [Fusibacter ferrireducens]